MYQSGKSKKRKNMISIAICDDERAEIEYLSLLAKNWAAARGFDLRIFGYESAESFLFAYDDGETFDVLLLDIQMKAMDGLELARRIRRENDAAQIVFITGYPDFISQGYDVSALHYLMKPVKEEKFTEVLDKAAERLEKEARTLLVQTADGAVKITVSQIMYVEAFAHNVAIVTKNGVYETRAGISDMEDDLGEGFVRCHRSYIASLNHISRITKTEVILDGGKTVPLSRRLYAMVNIKFIEFHRGRRV